MFQNKYWNPSEQLIVFQKASIICLAYIYIIYLQITYVKVWYPRKYTFSLLLKLFNNSSKQILSTSEFHDFKLLFLTAQNIDQYIGTQGVSSHFSD